VNSKRFIGASTSAILPIARRAEAGRFDSIFEIAKALWDSWADDAESGRFLNRERVRRIDWKGRFYNVAGPLNLPRSPQGRPGLVLAGSSATERPLPRVMRKPSSQLIRRRHRPAISMPT